MRLLAARKLPVPEMIIRLLTAHLCLSGIYWAIALLMAINNGINPMNGAQVPEELRSDIYMR